MLPLNQSLLLKTGVGLAVSRFPVEEHPHLLQQTLVGFALTVPNIGLK